MSWAPIAILAVVALLASMQALMWFCAKRSGGRPAPDTSAIDGPASGDSGRLHYFFSASRGPCQATRPMVEKLRETHRNLMPADIAQRIDLARKFAVAGTSSFVLIGGDTVRDGSARDQTERKFSRLPSGVAGVAGVA
ncbi:hypothetical protein [Acidovorax sp.]|nr:hypothetical protein [Acidovorax sp.]